MRCVRVVVTYVRKACASLSSSSSHTHARTLTIVRTRSALKKTCLSPHETNKRRRFERNSPFASRRPRRDSGSPQVSASRSTPTSSFKRVMFKSVLIREHSRELGGSGGVPNAGGIALGLGNEHNDRSPVPIEVYERMRSPHRSVKDEYRPSPARQRRKLLMAAMGAEKYRERHRNEVKALRELRRAREESNVGIDY